MLKLGHFYVNVAFSYQLEQFFAVNYRCDDIFQNATFILSKYVEKKLLQRQ